MPEKTDGGKILFSLRKICDMVNTWKAWNCFDASSGRRTDEGLSETAGNKTDIYH